MPHARVKGGNANVKRDEAPRRQPESLCDLKTNSSFSTHTANQNEHKPKCTKSVVRAAEGTRPYPIKGHVAQAIKGVHQLVTLRHGRLRVPAAEARDVYHALALLEARGLALDPNFAPELEGWAQRRLCLDAAAKAEIRQEIAADAVEVGPAMIGSIMHLHDAERDALHFWRAAIAEVTDAEREAKRRANASARARKSREKHGATPRSECRARKWKLHPELSRSTFYRRPEAEL